MKGPARQTVASLPAPLPSQPRPHGELADPGLTRDGHRRDIGRVHLLFCVLARTRQAMGIKNRIRFGGDHDAGGVAAVFALASRRRECAGRAPDTNPTDSLAQRVFATIVLWTEIASYPRRKPSPSVTEEANLEHASDPRVLRPRRLASIMLGSVALACTIFQSALFRIPHREQRL